MRPPWARKGRIWTLVLALVAAVFVWTNQTRLVGPTILSEAGGEVVDAEDDSAAIARKGGPDRAGRHLGFDTYAYPGHDVMLAWREDDVPYEWVGYYLPAPCHKGRTWVGKRDTLSKMGWGMAVIYVGQQTWDKTPTGYETTYKSVRRTELVTKRMKVYRRVNGKRVARYITRKAWTTRTVPVPVRVKVDATKRPMDDCNVALVSAERGVLEAKDAILRTEQEGFPNGSVIFLDIEHMMTVPQKMREYYRAWTKHVLEDGRYRPGYYVHKRNAEVIYADVKLEYADAGRAEEPPFWISGGRDFDKDKSPQDVGHSFAAMWQGVIDVVEEYAGFRLPLDVNVSAVPNPSLQYLDKALAPVVNPQEAK